MPTEETILDEQRKSQLDQNLRAMSEGGADNDAIMAYASDFKKKYGSPKSTAPSKTGGESGAYVRPITPSTPTSASAGSESESWTQTAKPAVGGVAAKPVKKAKYEPSNFGEILKKANLGVINPDLDEVVNKSKPMNVGGVEVSIKDKGEPAPMQRSVERKEADEDIDLLVTRTNVVRKMRDQEIDKAKQLKLGLEQIKQKGADLNEQYKVNPTPELEAQLNQTVKDLQDTEKAYNRAAFAQDVYEKRILQTSDSIKKLANDKVSDNFYMGLYKGMKGNVDSWEQAASLARMGKAEQIQYAKDQATKAPTKEASGGGGIGEMIGGVIPDVGVSIGFSLAGAPVLGAATVAARQGAQQAAEDFSRVFNEVKSSGLPSGRKDINGKDIMREATDDEAYDIAIRAAGMGAATGAAEGLVGTLGGGKLIGALASKARTQGGKIIAEKVLDTASDALIAGGMQVGRNAYDRHQGLKTELGEGVMENMSGEVLLSAPINTISGIGEYSKAKKETAVREVFKAINESKSNPYELQKLQSNLDVLKNQGMISNVDYNELNKKAEDYIRVVETIPTEVADKQKAADLIIERDELEAKKESVDKAFQKPIEEKINAINDELVVMATPVELQKNTSPTPSNYGTINRNDGKGIIDLTQEEFEAEQANMQPKAEGTAPVEEQTEEQIANNEYISNEIELERQSLEKDILFEEKDIEETEGKKGRFRKGLDKLIGQKNDEFLNIQKERLSLLNKDPLAYYEKKLADRLEFEKNNPEDANEQYVSSIKDFITKIKQQKATPEAKAGETIKTKTNEKANEDGEPLKDVDSTTKALEGVEKTNKTENTNTDIGYHGTPYNYDSFDASKIGTGEGASKRGKGIYFMRSKRLAPYFANINSEDAPIHIGKGKSKADKNKIDPRIFEISGLDNLKLKKGSPRDVSNWASRQQEFVGQGFDGFETTSGEITVFPESIKKVKIDSKNTIGEFIGKNADIEFREWTTEQGKENKVVSESYHKAKADNSNPELVKAVEELLTPKTTINEKNDEDGKQKRGKDGEEDVTKIVQSEGEDGGKQVDLEEKQVLATEGAVTAAPIVEAGSVTGREVVTPEGFTNRVFESNMQLGQAPSDAHISEEGYNYRVLSQNEIDAIRESGGVFSREGKQKGGNKNTKYWTKGNNKNWYGDKNNLETIRVNQSNFSENEVVRAENVEVYNKETGKFEPLIQEAPKTEAKPTEQSQPKSNPKIDEIFEQFETVDDKSNSPSSRRDANRKMKELISSDPKIKLIFDNIKDINRQLEEQQLITKKGNCP